jgi:hypothetical protein
MTEAAARRIGRGVIHCCELSGGSDNGSASQRVRQRDLVRRYQHTTGRTATAGPTIAALING